MTPLKLHVSFESVFKKFGDREVIRDISCDIQHGQVLVVAGPNGSGKSTFLRIAAGLLKPDSGNVQISVNNIRFDPQAYRTQLGYLSPDLTFYNELSAVENLLFYSSLRGIRLHHDDLASILEMVGLRGRGRDPVSAYSSGMVQRLKFAFAVLHHPPLLLLDEPTSYLDEPGFRMAEKIVKSYKQNGIIMIATNDAREKEWGDLTLSLG